jgi:hypothetical protein
MVDAAFGARFLQSTARRDLILHPIQQATRVIRCLCLLIVAPFLIAAQVLSDIHQLAGHSLPGGGGGGKKKTNTVTVTPPPVGGCLGDCGG